MACRLSSPGGPSSLPLCHTPCECLGRGGEGGGQKRENGGGVSGGGGGGVEEDEGEGGGGGRGVKERESERSEERDGWRLERGGKKYSQQQASLPPFFTTSFRLSGETNS